MYISGIHALNIPCLLETCGDWHTSALQWNDIQMVDSGKSMFGVYGIEKNKMVFPLGEKYNVANHIRALLDLLLAGRFSVAQGMRDDFICNPKYDEEIFSKVIMMKGLPHWAQIDGFMKREYKLKWLEFKERRSN